MNISTSTTADTSQNQNNTKEIQQSQNVEKTSDVAKTEEKNIAGRNHNRPYRPMYELFVHVTILIITSFIAGSSFPPSKFIPAYNKKFNTSKQIYGTINLLNFDFTYSLNDLFISKTYSV